MAQYSKPSFYALQHRGQEAAGIVSARPGGMRIRKSKGSVAEVFNEQAMGHPEGAPATILANRNPLK